MRFSAYKSRSCVCVVLSEHTHNYRTYIQLAAVHSFIIIVVDARFVSGPFDERRRYRHRVYYYYLAACIDVNSVFFSPNSLTAEIREYGKNKKRRGITRCHAEYLHARRRYNIVSNFLTVNSQF